MNEQKPPGMIEEWRDIPGYESVYQVSDMGRVRRMAGSPKCHKTRILKASMRKDYLAVSLCVGGRSKGIEVHRLIAWAFIGEQGNLWVNHKDGNKLNTVLSNLEYMTPGENTKHAYDHGLQPSRKGSGNGQSKLTEDDVWAIRMVASHCLDLVGGRKWLREYYQVSQTTITEIINGNLWSHVGVYP